MASPASDFKQGKLFTLLNFWADAISGDHMLTEVRAAIAVGAATEETHVVQALASYFESWSPQDASLKFTGRRPSDQDEPQLALDSDLVFRTAPAVLDPPATESDHGLPSEFPPDFDPDYYEDDESKERPFQDDDEDI